MTVYFIGAGPGAPDLLTLRGHRLIERCPVCLYAGSLVPPEVVAGAPATVIDTASLHLDEIIAHMAKAHAAGQDVARVHSGDPSLYGAIAEQMRRLDELNIPYEVVPGVSSFTAAAAALRMELTPAGANQTVILTRAPGRTGLPENETLAVSQRSGSRVFTRRITRSCDCGAGGIISSARWAVADAHGARNMGVVSATRCSLLSIIFPNSKPYWIAGGVNCRI